MPIDYRLQLTDIGLTKQANANANGTIINLTEIAVGDGNGDYYTLDSSMTALVNEFYRFAFAEGDIDVDPINAGTIKMEGYIPSTLEGKTTREIGIFDAEGDMIAHGLFPVIDIPAGSSGARVDIYITEYLEVSNSTLFEITVSQANTVITKDLFDNHKVDPVAHNELFDAKADKNGNENESFAVKDGTENHHSASIGQLIEHAGNNLLHRSPVDVPQTYIEFANSRETTDEIWEFSGDLSNNKLKSGGVFTCRRAGIDYLYKLNEDIPLGELEPNKKYHVVIKIKEGSIGKCELNASDVEILLLHQGQLWKSLEENIIPSNFELDSGDILQDKYNNKIETIGNPIISNGIVALNGNDAIRVDSINTLGSDLWVFETKVKFTTPASANENIFRCKPTSFNECLMLMRQANNKLSLFLSSNGSSWDIASNVLGTKNDYSTATEYYIKLYFTGTEYKVDWSTDGINWTNDITIVSSSSVYPEINFVYFGVDKTEDQYFLIGELSKIKVTIGNYEHSPNGRFFFSGRDVYINYPDNYTPENTLTALMAGEIETDNTEIINVVTYAFNRKAVRIKTGVTKNNSYTFMHNLGIPADKITFTGYFDNISESSDTTNVPNGSGGYKIGVGLLGNNGLYYFSDLRGLESLSIKLYTGDNRLWHGGQSNSNFKKADARVIVKEQEY